MSGRLLRRFAAVLAGAVLAITTGVVGGTASAAPGHPYTVHFTTQDTFTDTGLCNEEAEAQVTIDSKSVLHVNATEAGLTDEQILDAFVNEDPEGLFNSLTYTETGTFVVVEEGVTYTGRFTSWFGFSARAEDGHFVVTETFSARGTGDNGTRISVHSNGHFTLVDGEPVVEFDRGHVHGCAPAGG